MDRIDLPSEAVKINGQFIEDAIDGYKTVITSGREGVARELNTYSVGSADGETYKASRVPARIITVEWFLKASSMTELWSKLDHLNNILSQDEADVVFNDEPDKFYTGHMVSDNQYSPFLNAVKGAFTIYCTYPFKRSVDVITLTSDDAEGVVVSGNTATFTFDYNGTYPARPVLQAQFAGAMSGGDYSEDGDCGYVAFVDSDENIIQLGNPDAIDLDAYTAAETLINHYFQNKTNWQTSGGASWGNKTVDGSLSCSNIQDTYWNKGKSQTIMFVKPTHVTGAGWHGPILWMNTIGAVNWEVALVHRMCAFKNDQLGSFECGAYNAGTNIMTAGFVIEKTSAGTTGTVRYIVNGKQVGTDKIDLSYCNTNFGYCKRTQLYKTQYYNKKTKKWQDKKLNGAKTRQATNGYSYTQSNLNSSIKKSGSQVTFKIGNLAARTFKNTDIEETISQNISMHFGRSNNAATLHTNAVSSIRFTRQPTTAFADIPNVFHAGDIVEADCNDASVYLMHENTIEGHLVPQYGALGNDWDGFILNPGENVITATWSDWVNANYKPTIRIMYNEVFL